jgi:hypothetical protein
MLSTAREPVRGALIIALQREDFVLPGDLALRRGRPGRLVAGKGLAEPDRLFAVIRASMRRAVLPARPVDDGFVLVVEEVKGIPIARSTLRQARTSAQRWSWASLMTIRLALVMGMLMSGISFPSLSLYRPSRLLQVRHVPEGPGYSLCRQFLVRTVARTIPGLPAAGPLTAGRCRACRARSLAASRQRCARGAIRGIGKREIRRYGRQSRSFGLPRESRRSGCSARTVAPRTSTSRPPGIADTYRNQLCTGCLGCILLPSTAADGHAALRQSPQELGAATATGEYQTDVFSGSGCPQVTRGDGSWDQPDGRGTGIGPCPARGRRCSGQRTR